MSVLILLVRHLVGWVFLTAALNKATSFDDAQRDMHQYPLPAFLRSRLATAGLITIEIAIGVSMVFGIEWRVGLVGACALLLVFTALIAARKPEQAGDCGCGGVMAVVPSPAWHIAANVALASAGFGALTLAWFAEPRPLAELSMLNTTATGIDLRTVFLTLAVPLLLFGAAVVRFISTNWGIIMAVATPQQPANQTDRATVV
jgi:uncharacterized membrane protein YphA (DoxX/SURF4 family)